MPAVALSGSDTIQLNDRVITDLADANCVELTFPNEIANVKTGKNGNSIYGLNETGKQCEVKIRVLRGSSDDKYLNGQMQAQNLDFAGTVLAVGTFVKKIGNGRGKITSDTYVMSGGVYTKQQEAKMNVEGDTEQSVSVYTLKFSNSPRAIR